MKTRPRSTVLPTTGLPFENGDRLSQPEFHRRYETTPDELKAELIGGTVYTASPIRRPHSTIHSKLDFVLNLYELVTPGTEAAVDATVILGDDSEPQPDSLLRILPEYGGQSQDDEGQYILGAPEWLGEIAHSTVAIDLNQKKTDYLRAGVQEYLVVCVAEEELHWFHFPSRRKLKPTRDGVWKSKVFPGLWLDGPALFRRDITQLRTTLDRGLASPEHAEFVARLAKRRQ